MNSKLLEQKTEKHEIQMLSCDAGVKADENWLSADTSWVRDVTRVQRDVAGDQCARFCRLCVQNIIRFS